jgi:NitT/TauT family transport system permease protein
MTLAEREVTATEELEELESRESRRLSPNVIRLSSLAMFFLLWEIFGRQVNPLFMSYPSKILVAAWELLLSGELAIAFFDSLRGLILGFLAATVIGILVGLAMGRYRLCEYTLDPFVNALYATPLVALIPLVMLWLGLGFNAKVFIVFLLTLFPVLINTYAGVRNVGQSLVDVAVAFAAKEREIFTKIILPAALPYIMAGIRLGIGRAIIGMVVAEFFTSLTGLGAMVVKYGANFRTDRMLVPILILMIMGVALTALVEYTETRIAPWKETERAQK